MRDLKILADQKPIPTRKFSINGKVFESLYFDHLLFRLKENTLMVNSYFENLISMEEILNIELSDDERAIFSQLCSTRNNNMQLDLEERLSSQKINYKNIFNVKSSMFFALFRDEFVFEISINKELPNDYVIDLNFILKNLEETINF